MGIKIGSKKVKEIMYGNKVVIDIYYGSNHVYGREPKSNIDEKYSTKQEYNQRK